MESSPSPENRDSAEEQDEKEDPEVTISVTYFIERGHEPEFEAFLRGITDSASRFPGYAGTRVFRGLGNDNRVRVVFRFNGKHNLRRWRDSSERQRWQAERSTFEAAPPQAANITGTAQEQPLALVLTPLESFVQTSISGIGLLLLGTALALVLANSPLSTVYDQFWTTGLTIGVGSFSISESLRLWVNDGLMALFFFIVGLEIKREILVGELRSPGQAAFPIVAAIGGAAMPAILFTLINLHGAGASGWGIPMGTDTAFSLGVISLFGSRVKPSLLVFLTAFTIMDDILAVLVIAVFYTEAISWPALGTAGVLLLVLAIANRAGFHRWPVYAVLGVAVWISVFESGVHGTLAGVLVAMVVPARSWINPSEFVQRGRQLMDEFERACYRGASILTNETQQQATKALERLAEEVETPMTHFQHQVNPWVSFAILPLFAFANAGIPLVNGLGDALASPVAWGVIAGLVVGKPIGITLAAWIAVWSGLADRPEGVAWRHILGVAWLGGIGFTMSLFITQLAFGTSQLADLARVGILAGSMVAGAVGYVLLNLWLPPSSTQRND